MERREFLYAGTSAALMSAAAGWMPGGASAGEAPMPFDFARLKGIARALAGQAYQKPSDALPAAISALNWDRWQAIRFRDDHSVWANTDSPYQVRFAHLGPMLRRSVRMYTVENGIATRLNFDPAFFDYSHSGLRPREVPSSLGFGGFRLLYQTDWLHDIAAFQGASYFRAVDGTLQYGMSQRGLAVNCGMQIPEEFPDFVAYYLERPARGSDRITVYGLLDSLSVTGAYRFIIQAGDTLTMEIDSALYPRKEIERIGIAPGTSMFFYGKSDRHRSNDWRPEIHDSDGLQLYTGAGEWIWRPLVNPRGVRVNTFSDRNPRGFGLMQRERSFEAYQDDAVFYDRRPDCWVETKGDWGAGEVVLLELPTEDETNDNIVAFWTPADKPQPGREYLYGYKLYWCNQNPLQQPLAYTAATRTGIGGVVGQARSHFSWRFVVDFAGRVLADLPKDLEVSPVITASRGRIEIPSARPLLSINGYRAIFDLVPDGDSTEPINLRLYLAAKGGRPLTETWLYQYTPPPASARRF